VTRSQVVLTSMPGTVPPGLARAGVRLRL